MSYHKKTTPDLTLLPMPSGLPTRPGPPAGLGEAMGVRWREIVDDWPADHWRPSDLRLLEDLVITEQYVVDCDLVIAELGHVIEGDKGHMVSNPAVMQRRGHVQTIATIQRALRLCPSTRMRAENSVLRNRAGAVNAGKRPWETK